MICLAPRLALAATLAFAAGGATGAPLATAQAPAAPWLVWGGHAFMSFNPDALVDLDLSIVDVKSALARTVGAPGVRYESLEFGAIDAGALEILHAGPSISGVGGGELRYSGGLVFEHKGTRIDLRNFALRAEPGTRLGLAVIGNDGKVWLTGDHAHYGFAPEAPTEFSMRNMNLRIGAAFAEAIGRPDLLGYPIGGLDFKAQSAGDKSEAAPQGGVCSAPFSGPGLNTDVAMVYDDAASGWTGHDDSIYARRCKLPGDPATVTSCAAGTTTGTVVLDPDSSLRNIGTTGVAWYQKFSGNFPPYNNDQHPFLIWNLYRIDSSGSIKQIGASGVKHAFLTINWPRAPGDCGCGEGHVIYPTCEDTYSLSNNDNSSSGGSPQRNLAPRAEIIPHTAQWGRCGSHFDQNCDGVLDGGSENLYQYRMLVDESAMQSPASLGAEYVFEYWYVIRDDENIYNTMAYRLIQPQKNGSMWTIALVNPGAANHDFYLGPALSRWVDPNSPPANAANQELSTPLGRARIAVKASDVGGGLWRYQYAFMNFDFAHAEIDPAHATEPNLKVNSTHGFDRFAVTVAPGTTISNVHFDDVDANGANDWTSSIADGRITWIAPSGNTLDWGTMYRFEFTANVAPIQGLVEAGGVATTTEPATNYSLQIIGPGNDTIFADDFDP